eukprot:CAMPEP_0113641374 /NCGR_PEP_ID=MMETSP0017_2-20120614/21721_1 /TAXON_ID=2856 /ORGANISM="Cylindrotheca closterium" /LENGTH=1133 /DNA_ID=CAMNT_0000552715 /DNA_START=78 /DNA_END=3479 /DNA_ORIENTATION=+ /assembly_acc=CAM_ASM_000147
MVKENDSKSDDNSYIKEFDSSASTSGISAFTSSSVASSLYKSRYATPEVAIREQKAVRWSKVLVFFALLMAVSAVATITCIIIMDEEEAEFEYQFVGFASEIVTVERQKADQIFATMDVLSVTIASAAVATNSSWPFVSVPNWSYKVEALTALIGGEEPIITFSPIVEEYQRGMWSGYSMQEAGKWYAESIVAQKKNYTVELLMNGTLPFIHYYDVQNNFMPTPVMGPVPTLPAWEQYPLVTGHRNTMYTNYDMLQFPQVATLFHITNATRRTSMDFNTDIREASNSIMQPIFEGVDLKSKDSRMVGVVWLTMRWLDYFQNLLVEGTSGIVVVLRSSCSRVRYESVDASDQDPAETVVSYLINGPNAEYLGAFDAHDSQYDNLEVTKVLVDLDVDESKIPEGNCVPTLTLHLYPTEDFEERYLSNKALYYTVAVVFIFGFTSMVFILYDFFVGRRQRTVMDRIMKQDKIVSDVFPTAIRERLYDGHKSSSGDDLLGPSDFERQTNNLTEAPLADLFPDTTVMFADIAGFTAWSSAREPSQVFILLETIYGAFDKLAYRYGVFKVETVGDCYVAVGGLPEPDKEHMVAVARFARGCMKKMKEVTAKLEMTLGPDTSDLNLRIGMHSGQVTAGVLRGERSRFQLFGDTMNTAARMESSGNPKQIQMSQTTAKLLIEAGWSRLIQPRRHKIDVKGKGQMQTYWLRNSNVDTSEKNGSQENSGTVDTERSSNHEDDDDLGIVVTTKQERLVEWSVEILGSLLQQVMSSRSDVVADKGAVSLKEQMIGKDKKVLDEFVPIISLKRFDSDELQGRRQGNRPNSIGEEATSQLRDYISHVASMYRENPFHSFEHATHVTASVKKLLMRIVDTDKRNALVREKETQSMELTDLAGHSYGITSDPLTQFAVVFSAIIHDLDHPGVPNAQLLKEETRTAKLYEKSIAEQNSVDLAWEILMGPEYEALRSCIYETEEELIRFRQLVVNTVLATDIVDKGLQELRKARWETAFAESVPSATGEDGIESEDRKATIVIEHLIQASDVSHTMQHWHIYKQWNEKFFMECYGAFKAGRADVDPSINWYKGEIGFFDFYVIPLAKKLDSCGVFGVSSHEYLNYAMNNRDEWVREGEKLVEEYLRMCSSQ